jgi:hypothetical protein
MPGSRKRIAFSQLVDWVESRLSEEEARAVGEQVAVADGATLADVAWVRKFVRATEASILESLPPEVRSALIARFRAHAELKVCGTQNGSEKCHVAALGGGAEVRPTNSPATQTSGRPLRFVKDSSPIHREFIADCYGVLGSV